MPQTIAVLRIAALSLALAPVVGAQTLLSQEVFTFGGTGNDNAGSVDAFGGANPTEVVFAGGYSAPMSIAGPGGSTLSFPHGGDLDAFAARYRPGNDFVDWRYIATGAMRQEGPGIHSTADGRVLFSTAIEGSSTFGPGEPEQLDITSVGGSFDPVLCMLSGDGVLEWHDWIFGPLTSLARGFASSPDGALFGNVYGRGDLTVGFGTAGEQTINPTDDKFDTFLVRYSADGVPEWVRSNAGAEDDFYYALDRLPGGGVVLAGQFKGTSVFSEGQFDSVTLTSSGDYDVHLARYSESGALLWARRWGSTGADEAVSVSALPDGNVVVCGNYSNNFVMANTSGGNTTLVSRGGLDAYIAKVRASDGLVMWVRSFGSSGTDRALDAEPVIGYSGLLVAAGTFQSTLRTTALPLLVTRGGTDVFAATLDVSNGSVVGSLAQAGGAGEDGMTSLCAINDRRMVLSGSFEQTCTFDDIAPVPTAGLSDGFLWTLQLSSPSAAEDAWLMLE